MKTTAFVLVLLAMASCAGQNTAPATSTTTLTSGRVILNDDAAMIVTKARCERESTCGGIGRYGAYPDTATCKRGLFGEAWGVVRNDACPTGVDEGRVSSCAAAIRAQSCRERDRPLAEVPSCRRNVLCPGA